jgi:hypothetical protein
MQENINGWLEMDEGNPGFRPLTEAETAAMILFILISTTYTIIFSMYLFMYSGL